MGRKLYNRTFYEYVCHAILKYILPNHTNSLYQGKSGFRKYYDSAFIFLLLQLRSRWSHEINEMNLFDIIFSA